ESYTDTTTVKNAIQVKLVDDLTELFATTAAIVAGSGVMVSADDASVAYLDGKLVAGDGISFTVNNPAAAETMTIAVDPASEAETLAGTEVSKPVTPATLLTVIGSTFSYSRPLFTYADTDTITIGPGGYYLAGKGWVYWTANITFDLGSAGSNAGSDDLAASKWFHIALDYSAVSGAGVLTASDFINRNEDNVTPAYSGTKGGVYQDTNDRTIFSILTNGDSEIIRFIHTNDTIFWAERIVNQAQIDIDNAWTDIGALIIPEYATFAKASFITSGNTWFWRTNGITDPPDGHPITEYSGDRSIITEVATDDSQIIEVISMVSDAATIIGKTDGWRFPLGM
ncbi:hypothetical protein LCGC14_1665650, partial [marine sediment metagenome]